METSKYYTGVDISVHDGDVNFDELKQAGIDFVIIRAGYGKFTIQKDKRFEEYYAGAKKAGLHIGTYWYSYAKNGEEALQEAKAFAEVIKGKTFDMPVFIDIEEECCKSYADDIINTFNGYMESKGYFTGLYANKNWLTNFISDVTADGYFVWIAQYNSTVTWKGTYAMWQYTSDGHISGIKSRCDLNRLYTPIWEGIKGTGLNGLKKEQRERHRINVLIDGKEVYSDEI